MSHYRGDLIVEITIYKYFDNLHKEFLTKIILNTKTHFSKNQDIASLYIGIVFDFFRNLKKPFNFYFQF